MITILISMALMGQTDSLATGAKIRHESNKMIMGMQNVPYDVADVLNGSNYTVEQATAIAAQRRQAKAAQEKRERQLLVKSMQNNMKFIVKGWEELNKSYDLIITGKVVCPDDQLEVMRGKMRQSIQTATMLAEDTRFPRNARLAAKAHIKKAEAALAVLEKQNPGTGPGK